MRFLGQKRCFVSQFNENGNFEVSKCSFLRQKWRFFCVNAYDFSWNEGQKSLFLVEFTGKGYRLWGLLLEESRFDRRVPGRCGWVEGFSASGAGAIGVG